MAKILKLTAYKGADEPFVMEMPKYRIPSFGLVCRSVWNKGYFYVKKAGTFIFLASVLIWFASQYPKNEAIIDKYEKQIALVESRVDSINFADSRDLDSAESRILDSVDSAESSTKIQEIIALENKMKLELLENSYMGIIGGFIQPIFKPLGFDWRLSISLVTGWAAKEVIVSTMGVLYSLGEVDESSQSLRKIIANEVPFNTAVAFVLFVMTYIPCFAAVMVFTREAGKAIYALYLFIFTTLVAYVFAFLGYHIASLF